MLVDSPPNGVELIPPSPKEGAVVVVEITFVVRPVKAGAELAVGPKPKPP